ncbi:MAG: hypothetical protein IPK42_06625 [Betaproteobacteria bacterium]|nr:hypothetical protein [Betaproteobacteria bacterium]
MRTIELTIVLLILTGLGGALVRWARMGLPIFLVVIAAAASLLPGLDRVSIDPQLFCCCSFRHCCLPTPACCRAATCCRCCGPCCCWRWGWWC